MKDDVCVRERDRDREYVYLVTKELFYIISDKII